ncbi:zinc finger protein Aiolos-like [Periophthalmus magnuspinnatus]|uniref:zinc finger protein Aiolos-like n=1 Tax=Periophthalmus magnuspinnatus TaxID=409849 RepID=UPI0024366A2A|nr:zinc finger protein Aiolos-like [Periophthalmus magnuspinnatus]
MDDHVHSRSEESISTYTDTCSPVKTISIMNTDKHEVNPQEEDGMETCDEGADMKADMKVENEEEKPDPVGNIKQELDKMEDTEPSIKAEKDDDIVPKEERDRGSEDRMEEGFDQEKTEEEEDEDTLSEPQDLSLADYLKRYDNIGLTDAHTPADSEGGYVSGELPPQHASSQGKLNCDICGLSCVSINVLLVHKRSHTGERPFHCPQCGASFTQKGNLLRHIKLHSGEKPFKCPMCSYACRRRDALSGHLRTHSVEKPFKCNHCSRSYKQRSSLEEHRDRCHLYIQNKVNNDKEDSPASRNQMGSERALLLDRLASNVAKRKSSMPQKFTGDSGVCLDLSFNKEVAHSNIKDPPPSSPEATPQLPAPEGDPPLSHQPYPLVLTRNDPSPLGITNGHKMGPPLLPPTSQPSVGMDSFSSDMPNGLSFLGQVMRSMMHYQQAQPVPLSPLEALRAMEADGGAVYPCGHCKLLFLDYVMYTIHMGCHGFRDPFECNVCGHRSRDRYEFTSHIARGEHGLKYNNLKYT